MSKVIATAVGPISKERFAALIDLRGAAIEALRVALRQEGYTEITTASLVNIAGSCENPYASFTLNYYGHEAHLSQSAQLQLEAIVIRLRRAVFAVNSSFRAEDFVDPDDRRRRLSEFSLIEPERPYEGMTPAAALESIMAAEENVIKHATAEILRLAGAAVDRLGGDVQRLRSLTDMPFGRTTYDEALVILGKCGMERTFGDDLGIREERTILAHFDNRPTFLTYHPASIKFFNVRRTPDDQRAFSVDLLMPRLGETVGGAVREENAEKIRAHLLHSKIATYLEERGSNPLAEFREYLGLFEEGPVPLRGGFGIGFERYVGFLLNTTDILQTVAYRTILPSGSA